jgi:hypothetical protein
MNRESEMCLPAAFEEIARNRSMIVLEDERGNEVLFFWQRPCFPLAGNQAVFGWRRRAMSHLDGKATQIQHSP